MSDALYRALIPEAGFKVALAITTDVVTRAQQRHQLDPLVTIALGRAVACSALLASNLKRETEYVHLQFNGEGPMRGLVAETTGQGYCRAYAFEPQLARIVRRAPNSVGEALGTEGVVTVRRGAKETAGPPYTGLCPFKDGEVASDIARYLAESEQVPSAVTAGVQLDTDGRVLGAGGFLLQKLPEYSVEEQTLIEFENRLQQKRSLSKDIATGHSAQELLTSLLSPLEFKIVESKPLTFHCSCSRERMSGYLASLGKNELQDILMSVGKIEVICHYCAERYLYSLNELTEKAPKDH